MANFPLLMTVLIAVLGLGAAILEYAGKWEERRTKAQEKDLSQKRADEALDDYVLETIALSLDGEAGSDKRLHSCRQRLLMMLAMIENLDDIVHTGTQAKSSSGEQPPPIKP